LTGIESMIGLFYFDLRFKGVVKQLRLAKLLGF